MTVVAEAAASQSATQKTNLYHVVSASVLGTAIE
jgi:hypothetical protein